MDLGKWLRDRKKQVEGVVAQVNPFDGGKTYSSVTRKPTIDPFKSNNVNAKYGVLADKGRRDQFIQNNQRESFSTPIATFQSLRDIPGKIGNTLINNPIADKAADITGTNRQTSVEGRNSSDYLKPTGVIDNTVAAVSNLGQFNPIRSAGDIGQYLDTVSEKSRFKPVGDVIGNQTKDAANFGKPIEGSEWDARNLKNPVAKNAGEFSTMLGQTANFAVPVAGPLAIGGMIANEANETVNTARARGEDETIANLKGLLSGAGQAAVERYSSKLTTALPGSTKLAGLAKNKLIGIPASLAGGAITEGGEEFVQGLMGNAARGNDLTEGLKEQTIQGAKGGLLLGGFFGGANYAANRSQGTTQEAVQRVEQQNPTLQQTGIPAQPGSIRERIQQAKENVKSTIVNSQLAQNEGGYIRIPDFGKNLPNKPVKINTGGGDYNSKSPVSDSPLSPMEAVSEYQDYSYSTVNDALRENKITPRAKHLIDGLDNAFNKIGENRGVYTHRYDGAATSSELFEKTGIDKELKQFEDIKHEEFYNNQDKIQQIIKKLEGQEFTDNAYLSTSREKSGAEKFGDGGGISRYGIPAMVRISGETRVIDVARNGFTDNEQELLLPRNTSYRIKRAELLPTLREGYAGTRGEQYILGLDVEIIDKPGNNKTQVAKLLKDEGGGYDGGRTAQDRINDPLESLKQEASKYKSAEEFAKAQRKKVYTSDTVDIDPERAAFLKTRGYEVIKDWTSGESIDLEDIATGKVKTNQGYAMTHRPNEDGSRAFDLTESGDIPKDMYERWYGTRSGSESDLESIAALKKIRGNPEAEVTIYRASPSSEYNPGDWVTLSKKYAEQHAESNGGGKMKVYPKKVKAKDIRWAQDDINEFGYYPEGYEKTKPQKRVATKSILDDRQQLTDLYNEATKPKGPIKNTFDGPLPKKDPLEALKAEARKYGSAEEFDTPVKSSDASMMRLSDEFENFKQTDSIKKWFAGSRATMDGSTDSKPQLFFHRSDADFNEFKKMDDKPDYRDTGEEGIYFSKEPGDEYYGKNEYSVLLNAKKPYRDRNLDTSSLDSDFVEELKSQGYDSIDGADEFIVFEPSQIKIFTKNGKAKGSDLYNEATKKQGGLRTLMRDEGGGYTGKTSQERIGQAKFDAELRAKSAANLKKANIQITQGVANPKSDSPLTDKAYSETFGVSLEEAKKDITSINTSKTNPLDSVGMTEQEATRKLESNAPTMSPGNKKTKSLVDSMVNDKKLTEAARIAQKEGRELNYFAKKDNNGRSVGIEEYNPSRQRIEAGFVVDNSTGKVLGNHIKVDATGTQINVGGEVVNISDVVGNPLDWKGDYEVSSTMERNIFKNAPNKEIAQKTYKFVVANKIQAEATLRKEIESQRKTLNQNVKDVQKVKPRSVSDKDFKADIFDFIENKKSQADIASKYGPKATQAIVKYKNETRKLYDTLLDRANTELAKFGEKTIPKRSDYITHINELNQQPSFAGELMGQLQNSMLGEGYTTTRGGVPGDIAGRTETFSPRKRWNPFAQQRKGGEYTKDPFKAVDSYLEPTLYNIHMTESAVRARAVESAFRTAEILKNTEATKVSTDLDRELEKYKKQSNNAKLVSGFQEYANALAGKTQRWDRQVIDASKGTATALKGWQGLQRIGGRATILGNINSVLMQPLNQASVIAEVKLPNYIKGVASSLAGNNVEDKSPFIRARAAKIESAFRSKGQKVMDKAGIPLQFVELASVKLAWNAEYQQVLSEGLKGQDAIIEADRRTEKAVAGRGIADKPELYRSTLTNGLLQYTLEVNAQNKKFWRDLTPAQKGKFVVAAFGMNTVMEAVTGNEPLPDFLGAAIDTFRDFLDDDDDTPLENAGKGVQRFASEAVSMNPMLSAGANLLPDSTKKTLFGSDSDLTRFEGVPAPIGVIQNAVDVGKNVANGDVKKARDSALKLIPGGNQIRKTLQGKELIQDGGKYDKNGKLQYPAPESPLGKAQALLFGPSAIKNAREYYDSITDKISGISTKKDASGKEIDDFKTIATAAFGTEKGKEFMALTNDDERKEFARQSSENRGIYEQYKSMQKAFNGGDDLLPEGLSKESEAILNKYDRMEAKTKEDIFYRENDAEYKYELAKYEKDKLEGTISEVDAIRKEKSLAKQAIGSKYEKGIRDVYSLSKEQIEDLVTGDPAGKAIYDKLVKYDKELYDAGLISYLKFKNGLASGRGGRGRDKKDTSLTDKYALQGQTLSRLQKLLAGTTFAGAETVTTPKTQKAKQKKITVNMKA